MYIDKSKFKDVCSVQLSNLGATVNEAVDYIQEKANGDPDVLTVIHTGTRNLIRDSATTLVKRFERLETNIRNKKVRIAFSSIVHRNDRDLHGRIIVVNRAIKSICERDNWTFIDNDNIDESCLWKGGVPLYQKGKDRLASNFMSLKNFTRQQIVKNP